MGIEPYSPARRVVTGHDSTGKAVVIIDDNQTLGGVLNYARFDAEGLRADNEREALVSDRGSLVMLLPPARGGRYHRIKQAPWRRA